MDELKVGRITLVGYWKGPRMFEIHEARVPAYTVDIAAAYGSPATLRVGDNIHLKTDSTLVLTEAVMAERKSKRDWKRDLAEMGIIILTGWTVGGIGYMAAILMDGTVTSFDLVVIIAGSLLAQILIRRPAAALLDRLFHSL